jgi:hypothetical protein
METCVSPINLTKIVKCYNYELQLIKMRTELQVITLSVKGVVALRHYNDFETKGTLTSSYYELPEYVLLRKY